MNRLDSLENIAPYKIFCRGEDYYESGAVSDLEETSPDEWSAIVSGTEDYHVEISLDGNEITEWYCDCPYDGGDICKHVIATLFAIRAEKEKAVGSAFSKKKNKKEKAAETIISEDIMMNNLSDSEFQQQLLAVPPKDLSAFILAYASANPSFKEALLKKFVSPKISRSQKNYRIEIQQCFLLYYERGRSYYYHRDNFPERNWEGTFDKLDKFLNEASLLLKYGTLEGTIAITLQILQSIGEEYDEELVYNDNLCVSDYCERAGDLLLEAIKHPRVTQQQKNDILQELCQSAKFYPYQDYDVYDLEGLMQQVNIMVQSPEEALKLIDQLMDERKNSCELYKLVLQKVELLRRMNEPKKVENTIREYLYLSEIRKMEVEKLVVNARYDQAIEMLNEGIKLAEKEDSSYFIEEWMKLKLQIYEKTNCTSAVMGMCRQLFIVSEGDLEYYRRLKQLVPAEKWKLFLSSMMKETAFGHSFTWGKDNQPNIYVEEKDYENLFRLLSSCTGREQLDGLMRYAHHLKNDYSERLITLFSFHLLDYAEKNLGRNHYEFVAQGLSCMKKLNGGAVAVRDLVQEFREKYRRRPAMMEILNKF